MQSASEFQKVELTGEVYTLHNNYLLTIPEYRFCGPTSFLPSSVWNLMWKTQLSSSSSHPLLLGTGGVIFSTRLANGSDVFSIIASAWLHVDFVSFTTSLGVLISLKDQLTAYPYPVHIDICATTRPAGGWQVLVHPKLYKLGSPRYCYPKSMVVPTSSFLFTQVIVTAFKKSYKDWNESYYTYWQDSTYFSSR